MRSPKNLIMHEFIGLECEIVDSVNKSDKGLKGTVIDETLNRICIKTAAGIKSVQKKGRIFRFDIGTKVDIDGNYIIARPEDRIKKKFKRW